MRRYESGFKGCKTPNLDSSSGPADVIVQLRPTLGAADGSLCYWTYVSRFCGRVATEVLGNKKLRASLPQYLRRAKLLPG